MKHYQQALLQHLLRTILLLSIFSFAGFNSDVSTPSNLVVQTELVFSNKTNEYQLFSSPVHITPALKQVNVQSGGTLQQLRWLHDQWAQLQLTNRAQTNFSFLKKRIAFQAIKLLPASDEENTADLS